MSGKAVGRAAADLPWLCPNTDSLLGLAENPAGLAGLAAADPALLAFLVRFASGPATALFPPDRLHSPTLPETAAAYLASTTGSWLDPALPIAGELRQFAGVAAEVARRLAVETGRVDPDRAEVAARLAPLGWCAVAAVSPEAATACRDDREFTGNPSGVQARLWGLDHDAVARRLAHRWRFPAWLATLSGTLRLPFAAGRLLVEDADLLAVVKLAVGEAESRVRPFGLTGGDDRDELLVQLGVDGGSPEQERPCPSRSASDAPQERRWRSGSDTLDPRRVPLLPNLLRMAAESRRRNGAALVVRLEDRVDELHRSAAKLAELAGDRLRDARLAGLAELAAGAGHEINNPLAVISGNAQRLLRTEPDTDRGDALRSIVRQAHRISGILRDLMQFARPPRPEPLRTAVADVVSAVRDELVPLAEERGVRIELANLPAGLIVDSDPKQARHALAAVVRNGIEAVDRDGWVRIGCESRIGTVAIVVEDSGPGLSAEAEEHAFDPFYCGRSAGRGRGLGLATAWQYARQNGGELTHATPPDGPTRFVLTLPTAVEESVTADRQTA